MVSEILIARSKRCLPRGAKLHELLLPKRLVRPAYQALGLVEDFDLAITTIHHAMKIRHQYAHWIGGTIIPVNSRSPILKILQKTLIPWAISMGCTYTM